VNKPPDNLTIIKFTDLENMQQEFNTPISYDLERSSFNQLIEIMKEDFDSTGSHIYDGISPEFNNSAVGTSIDKNSENEKRMDKTPYRPSYPFRARQYKEKNVVRALRCGPARHDYSGYIYSASSKRPPNFSHNYFLPIYSQPSERQHINVLGKQFGEVDAVYPSTTNSAIVVFTKLTTAKDVIKSPRLGSPYDELIVKWMDPRLYNYNFYKKYLVMDGDPDGLKLGAK
jgi:hypothetical protein